MRKIIFLLSIIIISASFAQSVSSDSLARMLERAKTYYNNGEYENAINELEDALQFLKQLKQVDQVEAYKYLAFSYVAFGDNNKAKEQFKKALALNPKLELDPASVSPKIIKVFEEAKAEMGSLQPPPVQPPPVKPPVKPPMRSVSKFHATMRSCFVPGWGQMYKGHGGKGLMIMIGSGVTLGLGLTAGAIANTKHEKYDEIGDERPWDHDAIYDAWSAWDRWQKITGVTFIAFGCLYAYNIFDVLTSKPRTSWSSLEDKPGLGVAVQPNAISVNYKLKF